VAGAGFHGRAVHAEKMRDKIKQNPATEANMTPSRQGCSWITPQSFTIKIMPGMTNPTVESANVAVKYIIIII
jgi:hypothetical protein